MCLHVKKKQTRPKKATKDIVVHKLVRVYKINVIESGSFMVDGRLLYKNVKQFYKIESAIQDFKYELFKTYEENNFDNGKTVLNRREVEKGFHSYPQRLSWLKGKFLYCSGKYVLMKCIIPKGALYFEGTNNGKERGFCSNKLIAQEIIPL